MKIAMLMSVYGQHAIGGAERTADQIARGLAQQGHELSMVSLCASNNSQPVRIDERITHRPIPLAQIYDPYGLSGDGDRRPQSRLRKALWHAVDVYNPIMGRRLSKLWQSERPDVVITHTLQGFSVAAWQAARSAGAGLVHVVHDHALVCPGTAMTRGASVCDRPCSQCAVYGAARLAVSATPDIVVGPSQVILDRHRRFGWFSSVLDQRVIENAIARDWPPARPRDLGLLDVPLRFGYLGRLDESKGLDVLLGAIAQLPVAGWTMDIAGPGSDAMAQDLIARHDLSHRVKLLGTVNSADFLQKIDVLVTPSRAHETFCNVVMEAGCMGVPAIVSDRGALPERVEHGSAGWIVPAGDVQRLALAMERCIADRAEVERCGQAAAQSRARYEVDRQLDAWARVCFDLDKRRRAG